MRRLSVTPAALFALAITLSPASALGQQYKGAEDGFRHAVTIERATEWMPIQLVAPEKPDRKTLRSYEDAQILCGHRYAPIRELRVYPYTLAACVSERMHLEPGSLVKVIPLPAEQYKDRH